MTLEVTAVMILIGLIVLAGAVGFWHILNPSNLAPDGCLWCGERAIVPTGYVAHGYEREMRCRMCERTCYKTDPELKRQKREQLQREGLP